MRLKPKWQQGVPLWTVPPHAALNHTAHLTPTTASLVLRQVSGGGFSDAADTVGPGVEDGRTQASAD